MSEIADNLKRIREKMEEAARSCGRTADDVALLAVSKTFPIDAIAEAVSFGQHQFGESRVQEAEPKVRALPQLEWHLVGHLQSNKSRLAAELFDVIHSVDSVKLAARLNDACLVLDKHLSILLQVDLGQEATKFGADPENIMETVSAVSRLPGLRLDGLMTIPPYFEDAEKARPYFRRLRQLRDALETEMPGCLGGRELSMGMSHDYAVAIQEGATIIRIGTAIFGERHRD